MSTFRYSDNYGLWLISALAKLLRLWTRFGVLESVNYNNSIFVPQTWLHNLRTISIYVGDGYRILPDLPLHIFFCFFTCANIMAIAATKTAQFKKTWLQFDHISKKMNNCVWMKGSGPGEGNQGYPRQDIFSLASGMYHPVECRTYISLNSLQRPVPCTQRILRRLYIGGCWTMGVGIGIPYL
jgi:hypothetical protein